MNTAIYEVTSTPPGPKRACGNNTIDAVGARRDTDTTIHPEFTHYGEVRHIVVQSTAADDSFLRPALLIDHFDQCCGRS